MKRSRVLLALLVLLGFAIPADRVVSRWLKTPPESVHDPHFGGANRPGARVVQAREGWGEYVANSDGFLDDDLSANATERGVLVGDSFAQGLEVPYGRRFSEIAERERPGLALLNAGGPGRCPVHYALFLPALQRKFEPDFFVVQLNDGDLVELDDPAMWRLAYEEFQGGGGAIAGGGGPLRAVLKRSGLFYMFYSRVRELATKERARLTAKLAGRPAPGAEIGTLPLTPRMAASMDSLVQVMKGVNSRIVLLYLPHVWYFDDPPRIGYPDRRAFLHALADRHGLAMVDLTDAWLSGYARDREVFHGFHNSQPGEGHVNARGHELVGRLLAEAISQLPGADARPAGTTERADR